MSPREVAASYRLYAAYCFEAARVTVDPGRRLALLNMAQAWTDLADATQKSRDKNDLDRNDPHDDLPGAALRAHLTRANSINAPKSPRRG